MLIKINLFNNSFFGQKNITPKRNLSVQICNHKIYIVHLFFLLLFIYHIHLNFLIYIFKFDFIVCIIVKLILFFPIDIFILTCFLNNNYMFVLFYSYYIVSILVLYQVFIFIFYLKVFVYTLNNDFLIYIMTNI